MEKDIGKIKKNDTTDITIRVDDFGGKIGLTIREFVTSDRYTGFTKSGTRIPAESFAEFKQMINSIDESDFQKATPEEPATPDKPDQQQLAETSEETKENPTDNSEEIKEEIF